MRRTDRARRRLGDGLLYFFSFKFAFELGVSCNRGPLDLAHPVHPTATPLGLRQRADGALDRPGQKTTWRRSSLTGRRGRGCRASVERRGRPGERPPPTIRPPARDRLRRALSDEVRWRRGGQTQIGTSTGRRRRRLRGPHTLATVDAWAYRFARTDRLASFRSKFPIRGEMCGSDRQTNERRTLFRGRRQAFSRIRAAAAYG